MFDKKQWCLQIGERELVVETGELACQANAAVRVQYGDTVVLATATMSKGKSSISGYFPLMVDYEERLYAAGKIKGSRFVKREGRPTDEAVLTGRLIDRTIRPLFDMRLRNEVQVIITVLSIDQENDPDIVGIIAASTALSISDIPWGGPVAAVRVGVNGEGLILNPVREQQEESALNLVISGTKDAINMVEAGAREVDEKTVVDAFAFGNDSIRNIAEFIEKITSEVGKEKVEGTRLEWDEQLENIVREVLAQKQYGELLFAQIDKAEKQAKIAEIYDNLETAVNAELGADAYSSNKEAVGYIVDEFSDELLHTEVLERDKRPDGRGLDQIRPINCRVGVLPRTHGTGLFTRGETQALSVATLAAPGQEQLLDTMEENDTKKRYMHHYNFPPYSVGEVRPMRGPGRREIGHGALAERAIDPLIPSKEDFPYTIRIVSEILMSNGSSSMASVCGSTLALMDAGVPIKAPASGIAMGIIIGEDGSYKVLSDIQGIEDHYGDMDFKVAGTREGITALQMDVKVRGIQTEMLASVLEQSHKNRMFILDIITEALPEPRKEMSSYAPRIITMKINPDKIRDVIGPGGKVINEIINETGVEIDIEDDGLVFITSVDQVSAEKAQEWISNITREVKPGEIFKGRVTRIMAFGAFCEILPGQEGLVHISELADRRVGTVEEVVKVGDIIPVEVIEIDKQGRINLSLKRALKKQEAE